MFVLRSVHGISPPNKKTYFNPPKLKPSTMKVTHFTIIFVKYLIFRTSWSAYGFGIYSLGGRFYKHLVFIGNGRLVCSRKLRKCKLDWGAIVMLWINACCDLPSRSCCHSLIFPCQTWSLKKSIELLHSWEEFLHIFPLPISNKKKKLKIIFKIMNCLHH